ncbi:MAG: fibronectin type III domain-containing protein, partial [Bacteroidales bacterium]|nr:fibronectin type III domain-containing protein [Bacteroidales bacterium]
KEQPEADQAIDNQNEQFEADSKNLRNLYNWVLMTWDKHEPFLVQLGFAPKINRPGSGQPDVPAGFNKQWADPELKLSWETCQNTTSYQLVYSEDNEIWEDLFTGNETSFTYSPPEGKRTYRIRARNAKGYSDWSEVLEFTKPGDAE